MHGHLSEPTLTKEKARVTSGTTVGEGFSMEVKSQLNEERESAMQRFGGRSVQAKGSANKKTWKFGISQRRRER